MISCMNEGESVAEPEGVSLLKEQSKTKKRTVMWPAVSCAVVASAGVSLWAWQPWVDRAPFTAYDVSISPDDSAQPGSTPGSCVPHAAEQDIVLFNEDGKKLAQARQSREGEPLTAEFGDFAGDCLVTTSIGNVPGGEGTYVYQWGGGTKTKLSEDDLRRPPQEQRESLKIVKKRDVPSPDLGS
jgi:hypothetical protein